MQEVSLPIPTLSNGMTAAEITASKTNSENTKEPPPNDSFCISSGTPKTSWATVAHACNPSYSGGRDQEDHNLKPASGKKFT
jgi:hypothetical protein